MPDQSPSFEVALEADLKTLAAEIRNQRERPELQDVAEQDLVKEAIKAFSEHEGVPAGGSVSAAADVPPVPHPSDSASGGVLPDYAKNAPPEVKLEIEYLLDVALRQGLSNAFSESKKSPFFVQDAFHDALAGKLYPELQKRGMVK